MRSMLATILLVAFLAAPLSARELTGTLLQIKTTGKIRVGYRQDQPPVSFQGKDGKPAGYSIDLCKLIVDEVESKIGGDVAVEYVPLSSTERFVALSDNRIDILCGSTTKTLSRGELVDFTELTFVTGAAFMTLKNMRLMNNFNGKKIGVVKNTTTETALRALFKDTEINADIVLLNTTAEGRGALEKGEIDAFSADQVVLIGQALAAPNPEIFAILPNVYTYEPFALAVRRNDADFRLVADRVISGLCRTKQIVKLYEKWFSKFAPQMPPAFEALVLINSIPE
jgi:glutamate/aspartate transport system substrate-binding protein